MSKQNENAPRNEVQEDVIELGVASIETKGFQPGATEGMTLLIGPDIAE